MLDAAACINFPGKGNNHIARCTFTLLWHHTIGMNKSEFKERSVFKLLASTSEQVKLAIFRMY